MDPDERDGESDIESLEAYLLAIEGKPEDALARLAGREDPESLLRRLTIFLDAERFDEAASLVRGRPPHERWCEQAVAALAAVGDFAEADRFVQWAHGQHNPILWPVCLVALARHRFLHALRNRPARTAVLPGELNAAEQEGTRRAVEDVAPLVAAVKAQRRVLTGVDASAVSLAMEFAHFLGDRDKAAALANLLWARTPLPLNYAFAVIRKTIPANPDLPARLRAERGESYEAKRLAAFIEGTLLNRPKEAIKAVDELLAEYPSTDHQRQAAQLLLQLAAELPGGEGEVVSARAEQLLGPDSPNARFGEAEALVRAERYADALALLERSPEPEHPAWLDLMAAVRVGEGRPDDAVDLLVKATDLLPAEGLLKKAAAVAARYGRVADAVRLLERLLRAAPDDVGARARLGDLLVRTGRYGQAVEQFRHLRKLEPANPAFGLNEAICLARSLRLEESLRAYDELCAADSPPVLAVVGRAMLLKVMNRAAKGFASLERHKAAFWDHPSFLKAYIDLGYAAKREDDAHNGFLHLHQLQLEGSVGQELHAVGIDDLLKLFGQKRENEETLGREVLRGRLPWLLADRLMTEPAVAAFRSRTQPLDWLPEEAIARARLTIYATNGFVVTDSGDGRRWAEPIQAPEPGQPAVVDLSSIITLHRLGLLSAATDYFGECLYPSDYGAASLQDLDRLVLNQPSRYEAAKRVLAAVDAGRIQVASCEGLPFVHEHRPDNHEPADEHSYAFVDLIGPLKALQLLTDTPAEELANLARHPSGVNDGHPPLSPNDAIRVDLSSLESLQRHDLLGAVTSGLRVHVRPEDVSQLRADVAAWEEREALREQHAALWAAVSSAPKFVAVPHVLPPEFQAAEDAKRDDTKDDFWLPLFSAFVARERNLPLLVDDRACQMFVHNDRRSAASAFGTDALLAALLRTGRLPADAVADAYLSLMRWRFRFFVVPAEVMVALAKRSLANPPGQPLRRLARYVQDCMRDPGLFAGREPTDPPVTMAGKLFLAWTNAVSEFVVSLWEDPSVPEEAARGVSEWALTECLPAPPLSAGPDARVLADLQARALLSQALVRSATSRQTSRANGALTTIARVFGIGSREYLEELAEVADAL